MTFVQVETAFGLPRGAQKATHKVTGAKIEVPFFKGSGHISFETDVLGDEATDDGELNCSLSRQVA